MTVTLENVKEVFNSYAVDNPDEVYPVVQFACADEDTFKRMLAELGADEIEVSEPSKSGVVSCIFNDEANTVTVLVSYQGPRPAKDDESGDSDNED